ncbi:MAG TPA: sigma-70 family RNA polymerase sigma factor [Kofleriaceae bacterium]|jgi:RNA polymerase sigma-70 factor (ECF subfamily)
MDLDAHLAAIIGGDTRAFGAWLAGAEPRVRDSLRSFAAVIDVEAVLQETLLRIWQVAPRFVADGRPNGLLRLAIRIGRNLAVSEVRRTRATPTGGDDLEAALAAAEGPIGTPDPMLRRAIGECRDKLPARPRQALEARLAGAGGRADDVLAAELGMRRNTFLQNVTRARQLLADCLTRRGVTVTLELGP